MNDARAVEVEAVLARLRRWAAAREDVRALALVGSRARNAADGASDVDLVLLTVAPARYAEDDRWIDELDGWRLVRTQRWGVLTERRLALASGLEVELNVGLPSWAAVAPVDAGTRRVVSDGARILLDRDGLLRALLDACGLR